MVDLSIEIAGIRFQNPVFVSAGTFGYGDEFSDTFNVNQLGAIVTKTITVKPREGNPSPRIVPTSSGMLNSIGLQNIGIEKFLKEKFPILQSKIQIPLIVSIMGESVNEFVELTNHLNSIDSIKAIELNLSCPNVKAGGTSFSIDAKLTEEVVRAVKRISKFPIFAKLTPNVTDIVPIAKSAESAGADAIVAVNTFIGMAIDIQTRKSKLSTKTGGLSGPAIKPLALYHVYQISKNVKIPIIGIGGIISAGDAIEFITAGAQAICVGTGNLIDPRTSMKVIQELNAFMEKNHCKTINEIHGSFQE